MKLYYILILFSQKKPPENYHTNIFILFNISDHMNKVKIKIIPVTVKTII